MPGPFTPILHPHGFHGFWNTTGGRKRVTSRGRAARTALRPQVDLGPTSVGRPRGRAVSGQAYRRGPARAMRGPSPTSGAGPGGGGGGGPIIQGDLKSGGTVQAVVGRGAAQHVESVRVVRHEARADGTHAVTLATRNGARSLHLKRHPTKPGYVRKDTMTVTEDLGHDGQSPVTVMQGGSRLERCPICGRKLTTDGQCPEHGSALVTKAHLRTGGATLLRKEGESYIPSTGEARSPRTVEPQPRKRKKPPANDPVGSPTCPDCGGTDGYHVPTCPRAVLNPGGQPTGLGA